MNTKNKPEMVRLTIPVSREVHQVFQRFAKAASMPVGRAMGEWLGDTIESAAFVAKKMEDARSAPGQVARELHAYALGVSDEAVGLLAKMRRAGEVSAGAAGDAPAAPEAPAVPLPPLSNTGGKPTSKRSKPSKSA